MRSSPAGSRMVATGSGARPPAVPPTLASALLTPNCARLPSAFAGESRSAAREAFAVADVAALPVPSGTHDPAQKIDAECPSAVSVPMSAMPAAAANCRARRTAAPAAATSAASPRAVFEDEPPPDGVPDVTCGDGDEATDAAIAPASGESAMVLAALTGPACGTVRDTATARPPAAGWTNLALRTFAGAAAAMCAAARLV